MLAFTFIVGTQNINAQKIENIEVYAKAKSQEVQKMFNLDENDTKVVWRAYYVKAKSYAAQVNGKEASNPAVVDAKKRIEDVFTKTILMALDETQYKRFQIWSEKNNR